MRARRNKASISQHAAQGSTTPSSQCPPTKAYKRRTQTGPRQPKLPRLHCLYSPLTISTQNQRFSSSKTYCTPAIDLRPKWHSRHRSDKAAPAEGEDVFWTRRQQTLMQPWTISVASTIQQNLITSLPIATKEPPTTTHEKCPQRTTTCCSSYLVATWDPYKDMAEGLVQPSFTLSRGVPMKTIKVMGSNAFLRYKHSQILTPFI